MRLLRLGGRRVCSSTSFWLVLVILRPKMNSMITSSMLRAFLRNARVSNANSMLHGWHSLNQIARSFRHDCSNELNQALG